MARRKRPSRSRILLRWLAVCALALVAFLYVRPLRTYLHTRSTLASREAEVRTLRVEKRRLEHRLTVSSSAAALAREARRLGYVKPGERLYIVKGIPAWRRAHRAATIGADAR